MLCLKSDLQSIIKKSGESVDCYIQRIKELKDKLSNVSVLIDEEDLIIYALNDLPFQFNTFRTSMRTRAQAISFSKLHVLLVAEEVAIEKQIKKDEFFVQPTALLANNSFMKNQNSNPNYTRQRLFWWERTNLQFSWSWRYFSSC